MNTYKVAALACIFFLDGRELLAVRLLVLTLIPIIRSWATLTCIPRKLLIVIALIVLAVRLLYKLLISGLCWWFKWLVICLSLRTTSTIWKGNGSEVFLLRVGGKIGLNREPLHNDRLVIWFTSLKNCDDIVFVAFSRSPTDSRSVIVITRSSSVNQLLQERDLLLRLKILVKDWRFWLIKFLI